MYLEVSFAKILFFFLFLYNDSRDMQTHTHNFFFYTNGSMRYLCCSASCFFHEYGSDIVFYRDVKYFLILLYSGSVFHCVGGS